VSGFTIARLDEIDELDDGRCPWRPVRHYFGITSFGINAWTGRAVGDRIINEHDEADQADRSEELYLVTQGRAVFELDGERREAPAGTFVYVEPEVKRTAFAEEPQTTIVSIGGVSGKPYEVVGWEIWAPVRHLYAEGRYEEAAAQGRALIEANPEYPLPLYNLACVEALAGRNAEALEHLRRAAAMSERLREYAATDSDFDSIRDDPAFQEIVGG
jgi:tetratricopeptide (TPR) repeat protein